MPLLGQVEAVGAPVARMRAPLDQAVLAQAIDQAHQRDRLDLEALGHLGLGHALLALQPCQHAPLGASHAVLAGALVDVGPHRAGHIGELEQDLATHVRWSSHAVIISKLMIWWYCFPAGLLCVPPEAPRARAPP